MKILLVQQNKPIADGTFRNWNEIDVMKKLVSAAIRATGKNSFLCISCQSISNKLLWCCKEDWAKNHKKMKEKSEDV